MTALEYWNLTCMEHGIGRAKRAELERYRPPIELELMRGVKRALDPLDILNPGKVV